MAVCPLILNFLHISSQKWLVFANYFGLPNFLPQLANFLHRYIRNIRDIFQLCLAFILFGHKFFESLLNVELQVYQHQKPLFSFSSNPGKLRGTGCCRQFSSDIIQILQTRPAADIVRMLHYCTILSHKSNINYCISFARPYVTMNSEK